MAHDEIVDVVLDGVSLVTEYTCMINAVTVTDLVKKEYLADVPGGNGVVDLSVWFGAPKFESVTLTIYMQSYRETAVACAIKLCNKYLGQTVKTQLSFDQGRYRTGCVTKITPTGNEIIMAIRCDPYRYAETETVHKFAASVSAISKKLSNNGSLPIVPSVTVPDGNVVIVHGTARYTLSKGTHLLPRMVITGGASIEISVSGGACEIRYREAIL